MSQPCVTQPHTDSTLCPLPVGQMTWQRTPSAIQGYIKELHQQIDQLQKQIDTLQERTDKTSQNFSKPSSSDLPFKKPKRKGRKSSGKRGGQKGPCGQRPHLAHPNRGSSP